ncbi:hypothetical protein BGX27_000192 [Mortierella sp. AM989]|nr:hypothetical protein BGX27_000192 [Mortierella sp. AM989]
MVKRATCNYYNKRQCPPLGDFVPLLTGMGWNTFPFSVRRDPAYQFDIGLGNEAISVPSYAVEKDKPVRIVYENRPVLVVDEDKHIKNINRSLQWGEYRLAGDMLICGLAGNRFELVDFSLHGMRVIGTQFTFYHTILTEKYYLGIASGKEKMDIKRFPTFGNKETLENRSLDYRSPEQRKVILDALARMSHAIHNEE